MLAGRSAPPGSRNKRNSGGADTEAVARDSSPDTGRN